MILPGLLPRPGADVVQLAMAGRRWCRAVYSDSPSAAAPTIIAIGTADSRETPKVMVPPVECALMVDPSESQDMRDPAEAAEPILNAEATDPTDPIDRADPTEPMLKTDPRLATDSRDPSDAMDHFDRCTPAR